MNRAAKGLLLASALWLATCGENPAEKPQVAAPAGQPACIVEGQAPTAQPAADVLELERSVEQGPLFGAASVAGLVGCVARKDAGGAITLTYQFRNAGSLRVQRDAGIEFTEQVARFELAQTARAEDILARAEHAAFGTNGCGINWKTPDKTAAEDDAKATETVFRGDTCNCQARIRQFDGRIVRLTLRSAC